MPQKKTPPEDPKEQHKRFKEHAREIGADKDPEALERAFGKAVPPKKPKKPN